MQRFARDAKPCPGCDQLKVLAFYDHQRRPACAGCTGNPPVYACQRCGREDSQWGRLCGPCALADRATALLSQPDGGIHPQLQPVYETLLAGPRPQTTLYWFTRSEGPAILARMARGELAISHATFDELPLNKTNNYLRDLLTAVGVLPPFHPKLARVARWLDELVTQRPPEQAEVLKRFGRWHVMRRLHHHAQADTLTTGVISAERATIVVTLRFLDWLQQHQKPLTELAQADIDIYAAEHRGRATALRPFLSWTRDTGLTGPVQAPIRASTQPVVTLSDEKRWHQVHTLLHDTSIRLYSRVAGLFVILYAQPLARIVRMRAEQISIREDDTVTVTFDTFPIELPEPLDQLVKDQLSRRGQASYASRPDRWLFPGGHPGAHLATENIRAELVRNGIQPKDARNAAMFHLAATMPTPILADVTGLAPNTATRWAALASRDWSYYTAQRRSQLMQAAPSRARGEAGRW